MSNICDIAFMMQFAAAFAGVIAAVIWWRASCARTPSDNIQAQMKAASGDIVHVLDRLMQDVASQSRLNGHAAIFAALAIVLQVISLLFTSQACWGP
jgi:glycerol uptake facilitator-like aquaporin